MIQDESFSSYFIHLTPIDVGVRTCSKSDSVSVVAVATPSSVRHQVYPREMKQTASNQDIVCKLIRRNVHHVLENIFLSLSVSELYRSRLVCKAWWEYIKKELWQRQSSGRVLRKRLDTNWRTERHKRVELKIEEIPCRENCLLNERECNCEAVWQCDASHVTLLLNTRIFSAIYSINNQKQFRRTKHFQRPQYPIKLSLKNDLEIVTTNFLSTPLSFRKKSPAKKVKTLGDTFMEIESTFVKILDKENKEIFRFLPHTGWGEAKPIRKLSYSSGRLAVLMSGRVYVYCCQNLLSGSLQESLLLVATRQTQPPVEDFMLGPNFLITVGGKTVVLFDFWSDNPTSVSEFFC